MASNKGTNELQSQNEVFNSYLEQERVRFVTFHPSYSYEEFIEGLTVSTNNSEGNLRYELKPGLFKNFCTKALLAAIDENWEPQSNQLEWKEAFGKYSTKAPVDWSAAPKFVLIIDEINRGDIAKIFGELITLLEADKRLGASNEFRVTLPISGDQFSVPQNVFIIGTMNTADRSIALLDIALRRRFGFHEIPSELDLVLDPEQNTKLEEMEEKAKQLLEKSVQAIKSINIRIKEDKSLGKDKSIGHAFLFGAQTVDNLLLVWKSDILPLLEEYCYGREDKKSYLLFKKESELFDLTDLEASLDRIINTHND